MKKFEWEKLGLIFKPDQELWWQQSHAALPTKLKINNSKYKIFFTSRDQFNKTYIGSFDIDLDSLEICNITKEPLISPGKYGFFDDHGVQACSVINIDNKIYLYYLGWNPSLTQPLFYTSIGLAFSEDNGISFKKYSKAPILQRSEYDPWMVSGGTVIKHNNQYYLFYLSGFKFEFDVNIPTSYYDIKIATSKDGINWNRDGHIALPLKENETNISRPTIEYFNNKWHAFYPVKTKNEKYSMGYANSDDLINWTRLDDLANLVKSENDFDSEAHDKMEVIHHKNKLFLFYNGNRFGYDGIGLAIANV